MAVRQTRLASNASKQRGAEVKRQVNGQHTQLESQLDTQLDRQAAYRGKCQRLAAGSCPAFPTLALQNPAQIFPGSDTSLALGSFLHVERNKRRITPTVLE